MSEYKLSDMIASSLDKVRELASTDTVVGEPINTPGGIVIIPVSKVSMGFVSGGLDYDGRAAVKAGTPSKEPFFGGGGGTGITVTPIAFILVFPEGRVEIQNLNASTDTFDKIAVLAEKAPGILEKLVDVFKSKFGKKEAAEAESEEPKTE